MIHHMVDFFSEKSRKGGGGIQLEKQIRTTRNADAVTSQSSNKTRLQTDWFSLWSETLSLD